MNVFINAMVALKPIQTIEQFLNKGRKPKEKNLLTQKEFEERFGYKRQEDKSSTPEYKIPNTTGYTELQIIFQL